MKFDIDKQDLLAAISTVARAISSKAASPVLEGILLEANVELSRLRLIATDTALQIETFVPANVVFGGIIVLPGRLFYESTRRMPEGTVEIVKRDDRKNTVSIRCGKSKINMQGFSADEFPEMPPLIPKGQLSLPQARLASMIGQTLFAVAAEEGRPILTGSLMEVDDGILSVVGLDGFRLAIRVEPCFAENAMSAVVPQNSMSVVRQVLGSDGDVTVTLSGNTAMFDIEHTKVTTVLLSGEYMKYKKIIPQERLTTVQVNRAELMSAIDRASLMARDNKNNLVRFAISTDELVVTSNSEAGDVLDEVPIHLVGGELDIAFNAKYMTDVLKVLNDEDILLEMNTSIAPCVIRPLSGNAWLYLVLPVRVFN